MLIFPISASLISIFWAAILIYFVRKYPIGEGRQIEIWQAIQEGSSAYLKRQTQIIALVALPILLIIWYGLGWLMALGFILGACASAAAGYVGMKTAVASNIRTTEAAKIGLSRAFRIAFLGGSVTGFLVVGLGLLSVSGFYFIFQNISALVGLGLGGSLISIFARLGGGIFTKAADVGADLVGKIEAGIPEDDPRNPAVIADNVGDNVGDCAGMAADLFETYTMTIIAAMFLSSFLFPGNELLIILPLLIGGVGIISSILGSLFVRVKEGGYIMGGLYKGLAASSFLILIFLWFVLPQRSYWLASLIGILVTGLMVVVTEYYTSKKFRPVKSIAFSSLGGHATNIIMGLALSLEAAVLPILIISLGALSAFLMAGLYGVALAAATMLAIAGMIVAIDSFGPIVDNAGGIAEMAGLDEKVRIVTDSLDAVGNTTKAVTKGYAIASAGLTALVLFSSYAEELSALGGSALGGKNLIFDLANPYVIVGLFIGGMMPYLFGSITLRAVGKTAQGVVDEARSQFKETPGILEGTVKPNYARTVDIVTKAALKQMILPALIPVIVPILVVLFLGKNAALTLGGVLIGSILVGLFMAISMTSGGGAWDNAKKYIEEGNYGGKKSLAHQAAVTGDTVGDPYKDTVGPAINPMIKIVNIVALLLVRFL